MGRTRDLRDRLWDKVEKEEGDGCWLWTGATCGGYGTIHISGRGADQIMQPAHRVAYELEVGPIPEGLQLDHLCRRQLCVRPTHLDPVTPRENVRRSDSPAGRNARKEKCNKGHPFTDENTYVSPAGRRICRSCRRTNDKNRYDGKRNT